MSHGHAVVGHRYILAFGLFNPCEHLRAVEHAGTAVDDEVVGAEVVGEVVARHNVDVELLSGLLTQEARNLHAANVLTDGSVRTGFGNEDVRMLREAVHHLCALSEIVDVTFSCCKEDGECGQPALLWH